MGPHGVIDTYTTQAHTDKKLTYDHQGRQGWGLQQMAGLEGN